MLKILLIGLLCHFCPCRARWRSRGSLARRTSRRPAPALMWAKAASSPASRSISKTIPMRASGGCQRPRRCQSVPRGCGETVRQPARPRAESGSRSRGVFKNSATLANRRLRKLRQPNRNRRKSRRTSGRINNESLTEYKIIRRLQRQRRRLIHFHLALRWQKNGRATVYEAPPSARCRSHKGAPARSPSTCNEYCRCQ